MEKKQCYLKIVMSEEQKLKLKMQALQENKSTSKLVLEKIGLRERENIKDSLFSELKEKQSKLSNEGTKMTPEERKEFKDRIRYIKRKLQEI